jgi:Tol biopolymer transport system component
MQPIWSPDGTKLAFTKLQFAGVYVRNADGSGPIRELTSADYSGHQPVWTSDSRGIVIRSRTGIVGQGISYVDVETGEVRVLEEQATHPGQPERNVYGDVMIDVDGERTVLDLATVSLESRDGYYSDERPASRDLRIERSEGDRGTWVIMAGDGTQRVEFPHRALLAGLSPSRDRVAFLQGDGNLYLSNLDGSGKACFGRSSGDWDWSPDGRTIVFVGAVEDNGYTITASELFVAGPSTGGAAQLSDTPGTIEMFPSWSPDGRRIAYSTHRAGKICVAVLEEVE